MEYGVHTASYSKVTLSFSLGPKQRTPDLTINLPLVPRLRMSCFPLLLPYMLFSLAQDCIYLVTSIITTTADSTHPSGRAV